MKLILLTIIAALLTSCSKDEYKLHGRYVADSKSNIYKVKAGMGDSYILYKCDEIVNSRCLIYEKGGEHE